MLSTIKVDFKGLDGSTGFEPCIKVRLQDSDDVRDKLLKTFFQSLGGTSNLLKVNFRCDNTKVTDILIEPVTDLDFNIKEGETYLENKRRVECIFNTYIMMAQPEDLCMIDNGSHIWFTSGVEISQAISKGSLLDLDTQDLVNIITDTIQSI